MTENYISSTGPVFSIAKSLPCILSNHNEQWFQFKGWSFHESMVRSLFDDKGYPKRKASGILLFVLLALLRGMPFVSKEDYSLHRQPPWKPMVCLTFWSEAIFLEATSTLHLLVQFQTGGQACKEKIFLLYLPAEALRRFFGSGSQIALWVVLEWSARS